MTMTTTTNNSAMRLSNKRSLGLLVAMIATMNFQAVSACSGFVSYNLGGGTTRLTWLDDSNSFEVAGGGTTTCSVSGNCDYGMLQIVYGDDVGGSNAFNGASGSVGSLHGSAAKSCDFSVTMSDSNDATTLGLSFEYISIGGGDLTLQCTCTNPPKNNPASPPPSAPGGGSSCFSGSATVQVENKGPVSMKNLQVGDRVLTGSSQYQPVYSFGHRHEDLEGTFYQIYTESHHAPLEMTGGHLIFVLDSENQPQSVRADTVKAGDRVLENESQDEDAHPALVTKVAATQKKGMYMPLTPDGSIIVNGILASTYVSLQDQAPVVVDNSKLFPFLTEDKILHLYMSPLRMLCLGVSSNACQFLESRDEEGVHFYLVAGRSLAEFADIQGFFVQVFLIGIPVFLMFAFLNLLEVLLGGPALAPFVCFAAITLGGWVVNKAHGMTRKSQESRKKLE